MTNTIDLHGLHVDEALRILDELIVKRERGKPDPFWLAALNIRPLSINPSCLYALEKVFYLLAILFFQK